MYLEHIVFCRDLIVGMDRFDVTDVLESYGEVSITGSVVKKAAGELHINFERPIALSFKEYILVFNNGEYHSVYYYKYFDVTGSVCKWDYLIRKLVTNRIRNE